VIGAQTRPLKLCDTESECYYEYAYTSTGGREREREREREEREASGEDGGMGREDDGSLFPNLSRFLIRITFSYSYEQIEEKEELISGPA
jgi:hypothetical protein